MFFFKYGRQNTQNVHRHWYYLCCLSQGWEEEAVPWELTSDSEPRSPPAPFFLSSCIPVWTGGAAVHHEEQLSRPACRRARGSAAVSGLLRHQMAVSILRRSVRVCSSSLLRPFFTIFTSKLSKNMTSQRYAILCRSFPACFIERRAPWQLWNGAPNIPRVDRERGDVCCTCVSDGGDRQWTGARKPFDCKKETFFSKISCAIRR